MENYITCFIGHRDFLPIDISTRIFNAVQEEIKLGCTTFRMGKHGEFDACALRVCNSLQLENKKIELVLTSSSELKNCLICNNNQNASSNIETIMFETEEVFYKQKITISNQLMINNCKTLICYVNPDKWKSGAKRAMKYAENTGLKIVNLFKLSDISY